jgi:hypothetical protein
MMSQTCCGVYLPPCLLLRCLPTTFFGYCGVCLPYLLRLPTTFFGYCGVCLPLVEHSRAQIFDVSKRKPSIAASTYHLLRRVPTRYCRVRLPATAASTYHAAETYAQARPRGLNGIPSSERWRPSRP